MVPRLEEHATPVALPGEKEADRSRPTMSTQLEPQLLRGLPLHEVLAGWGRHWRKDITPETYELSRPTTSFDGFLSHDWASSGWHKFFSLLIVFNSGAAFWSCLLVSLVVGVLRGCCVLPDEPWTLVPGHVVYFLVFFYWHRLRGIFCRPQIMFLDKVCVAQFDDELKQKAIMGLAAFLVNSDELIVLLSSRYFTRLWCTFEIATFMKDPERRKNIRLMPLKSTVLLYLMSAVWFTLATGWSIFKGVFWQPELVDDFVYETVSVVCAMLALCAIMLPFAIYVGMEMSQDMEDMPKQLRRFSVQDATCLCCSNHHLDPDTGTHLACDRQILYATMKEWYGAGEDGDFLETFNTLVRKQLASRVELLVGGYTLPLKYMVYMVAASSVPYLAIHVSLAIYMCSHVSGFDLLIWILRDVVDWGIVPVTSLLTVKMALPLFKFGLELQCSSSKRCRWCVVILLAVIMSTLGMLIWAPTHMYLYLTYEDDLLPVLAFVTLVLLALGLTNPGCPIKRLLARRTAVAAKAANASSVPGS